MPWVRFWASASRRSGPEVPIVPDDDVFVWYDRPLSKEVDGDELKNNAENYAEALAPTWIRRSPHFHYGFEIIDVLPADTRDKLIQIYQDKRTHAEQMLQHLMDSPFRVSSRDPGLTVWDHLLENE